jgi:hypothetical protein
MPTATLLEKAYSHFPAEAFESTLKSLCKGLKVQVKVKSKTVQEWIQVEVNGEDESVSLQLLNNEFGLAPNNADNVEKFSVLRGKIVDSGKTATELCVDVGVFTPRVVYAKIPLQNLQAQLADGKKLPLQRLTELFCLLDYVPLNVKIVDTALDDENGTFSAELSERQLALFTNWLRSSLDRLVISGAQHSNVEYAVEASRHFRDVVNIESLGWLEHAIVCKLGTDAVGLIPAMGRFMRTAILAPFSPRKVRQIVDRPFL